MRAANPEDAENDGAQGAEAREAGLGQRCPFAHGRDGWDAGRADRRTQAGEQSDEHADQERHDDRARLEEEPRVRQREAHRVEEPEEDLGEAEAEEEADHRGDDADDERLEDDGREDLAARGADRPHRGELTRPLRDRDREGVRDHEGADEEGDAGEDEQEGLQERDELVGVLGIAPGLLRRGLDLGIRRQHLLELLYECLVRDSGLRRYGDLVELAFLVEDALRRREVEARQRGAADGRNRAELDDSGDVEVLNRAGTLDADGVADLEVLLVGGRLVDDDLAVSRPGALDELKRD